MITKYQYAPTDWLGEYRRRKAAANNATFNKKMRFNPNHPTAPALQLFLRRLIAELNTGDIPEKCRPPIPTGAHREAQSCRTAETLLANILRMAQWERGSLAVAQYPSFYTDSDLSSSGIINLIKLGERRGLWTVVPGVRGFHRRDARLARLIPEKKFWALQAEVLAGGVTNDINYSQPTSLVILRDEGAVVPPHRWKKIPRSRLSRIESALNETNRLLATYSIRTKQRQLFPVLYTVFSHDFQQGGRFYTAQGGHTSLPRSERLTITFARPAREAEPSVELDYAGLHVRMLYHFAGSEFPHDEDPYAQVLHALGKDPAEVFDRFPSVRGDLKIMLLAFINGRASHDQQINNANFRLFRGKTRQQREVADARVKRWREAGLLRTAGAPTAAHVIDAFKEAHHLIEERFSTGCGLHLQNLDASMSLEILEELTQDRIPTLPVHDSFIVPEHRQERLARAMAHAYSSVMKEHGVTGRVAIPIASQNAKLRSSL